MTTGFLSAFVVMAVWSRSLAQLSGDQPSLSFVESKDSSLHNNWNRVVVPHEGTYIVSVTVDPNFRSSNEEQLEAKRNGQLIFTALARTVISNTAMALHLNANDVITAVGGFSSHEANRLSVTFTSVSGAYYTAKVSHNVMLHDGLVTPFNKVWSHPGGGWTDRRQNYIQVSQLGVYWVMARVNAQFDGFLMLHVTLNHPVTGHLYDVMTIISGLGDPVSSSGAFVMAAHQSVMLMSRSSTYSHFEEGSMLSVVYLDGNEQKAFTAQPMVQSQANCEAAGDHIRWDEFPQSPDYPHMAREGHPLNAYNKLADLAAAGLTGPDAISDGHRTKRSLPLYSVDPKVLVWSGTITTNYGNMGVAGDKRLTIQVSGVYVVGMRPENAGPGNTYQMGFLLYRNREAIWSTWSEGAASGETFGWRFTQNDHLVLRIFGACVLERNSLFSVALLTRE